MRNALSAFLTWGVYPAWLLAGAVDYLCHRKTDIAHTTGATESWLHLAQFVSLALALAAYTDGRRHILPVEQMAHGFMDVLPLVATALFGILHWDEIRGTVEARHAAAGPERALLLSSFLLLAGLPILEELLRSRRSWQTNRLTSS